MVLLSAGSAFAAGFEIARYGVGAVAGAVLGIAGVVVSVIIGLWLFVQIFE